MPDKEPDNPPAEDEEPTTAPEAADTPEEKSADTPVADNKTEAAVDDIVAKEGDTSLAVEDAKRQHGKTVVSGGSKWQTVKGKLVALAKNRRFQVGVAVVLVLLFVLPFTRYKVLGLVIRESVTVSVVDSKTNTPVSGADVKVGGGNGKTDGNGKVTVKARPGNTTVAVQKQYCKDGSESLFVGLKSTSASVKLTATGRLVPVSVVNKVTGKPVLNAQIKVLGTTAKTDSKGKATIALPTDKPKQNAKLSLAGYNSVDITIEVTDKAVKTNDFAITPEGQIYFLSNLSGKLDVVKSNLDGSVRKTVLEGTGNEDAPNTSLLASRDWKYLALLSRRDGDKAALYLIDTSNDKTTQFDNGDADFNLVGWSSHRFVYDVTRNNLNIWQSGRQVLKSYDADRQQLNLLDQNAAEGSDTHHYRRQFFGTYSIVDEVVIYPTYWDASQNTSNDNNDSIRGVKADGQDKKDYKTFGPNEAAYISAVPYEAQSVYFDVRSADYQNDSFYEFEDGGIKTASIDTAKFNDSYPTFLQSPSGKQTFWAEFRDGKNTLFVGDSKGENKKQVAALSDFQTYGWYDDDYTLVSKNGSELYILPAGGLADGQKPLKITDYYKPAVVYRGYGGGYGGL